MRTLGVILKVIGVTIGSLVALIVLAFGVFAWSDSNISAAHGRCEMRALEAKIPDGLPRSEHRRNCMKAEGYRITFNCHANRETHPGCFMPKWVIWADTVDA